MSFYDLEFNDSGGNKIEMRGFEGKVLLIVNTATKCGLSPQFEELEQIYQKYKNKNFSVIGFPCNQFANQEPETNQTMTEVCKINYGVTFQLSELVSVNGENTHQVFAYLKENAIGGIFGKRIKWNFTKFLVSEDGKTIRRYSPTTKPFQIEKDIIKLLEQVK